MSDEKKPKVFVVVDDTDREHRYEAFTSGITGEGAIVVGERQGDSKFHVEPTAVFAPGRWTRAYVAQDEDGLLAQLIDCGNEADQLRALLGRAVRELDDSGSPGQNALAAELARDGGIEL